MNFFIRLLTALYTIVLLNISSPAIAKPPPGEPTICCKSRIGFFRAPSSQCGARGGKAVDAGYCDIEEGVVCCRLAKSHYIKVPTQWCNPPNMPAHPKSCPPVTFGTVCCKYQLAGAPVQYGFTGLKFCNSFGVRVHPNYCKKVKPGPTFNPPGR